MARDPNGTGCVGAARAALGVLRLGTLDTLPPARRDLALEALVLIDRHLTGLAAALDPSHEANFVPVGPVGEVTP